ncbi:hypothetical protein OESDEN_13703 [Oesophagostomum dentatum]|uniref:Uncharacterized protein n=1 Tax=Oesophagostomum dentatum TaxID=61180 RepID=A0A0B1STK6_OESDE|nr:hypothetical protein OESDEN_13703 [Oesophagostomum dentatum]
MSSLQLITALLAIVAVAVALRCYSGEYENDVKPSGTTECNGRYCTK